MKRLLYRIATSSLLVCGLAAAGCGTMGGSNTASSPMVSNSTTQPSGANSSDAARSTAYQADNNQHIGNGAFGESPP